MPGVLPDENILQQDFKAIGVKIDIQNYPASTFFGTFLPAGKPGKYDLAEFENDFPYDADDASEFACAAVPSAANSYGGQNFSFYCNKKLDSLLLQEQATDSRQRTPADFQSDPPDLSDGFPIRHPLWASRHCDGEKRRERLRSRPNGCLGNSGRMELVVYRRQVLSVGVRFIAPLLLALQRGKCGTMMINKLMYHP